MVMIKDLTDEQVGADAALRNTNFPRFETEPNMVLELKPSGLARRLASTT